MQYLRYSAQLIFLWLLAYCSGAAAQQRNLPSLPGAASAQGQLTVTLTIVPSVGVVLDDQGNPRLIMANGATASDNVSSVRTISWARTTSPNEIQRTMEPVSKGSPKKQSRR